MSNGLELKAVSANLGEREVCRAISFAVREGGFASILGASGAGKSTLLRCVAGLTECSGEIRVGAKILQDAQSSVAPEARGIGFLFQGLGLWPDHSVEEHLRMVLQPLKLAREDMAQRIGATLEPLGLSALAGRVPGRLSGGERQRLALARALVTRPRLLLLDEPTSSVDQGLKRDVRELLDATRRREGCTVLHVTHDHEEALELADHLILMHEGCVVQQGPPASLWEQPMSRVVARMLGEGVAVEATLAADGTADTPFGRVATRTAGRTGPVWILVRSSHLRAGATGEGIPAPVSRKLFLGARSFTCVTVAGREHRVENCDAAVGSTVWVSLHGCPPVLEERSSA